LAVLLVTPVFAGAADDVAGTAREIVETAGVKGAFPKRGASGKRLITTHGLPDDDYNEGKCWTYGDRWPGWDRKIPKLQHATPVAAKSI